MSKVQKLRPKSEVNLSLQFECSHFHLQLYKMECYYRINIKRTRYLLFLFRIKEHINIDIFVRLKQHKPDLWKTCKKMFYQDNEQSYVNEKYG